MSRKPAPLSDDVERIAWAITSRFLAGDDIDSLAYDYGASSAAIQNAIRREVLVKLNRARKASK